MYRGIEIGTGLFSRRELVKAGLCAGALVMWPVRARADEGQTPRTLPEGTRRALDASRLVYVSPLHPDGAESRCHGEVWFFVDGGDVVLATQKETWKARAVAKGWDQARLWAGDFGPVSQAGDRFRSAPEFRAHASLDKDPAAFERLMQAFATKYADEWTKWRPRFRESYTSGARVLLRYRPIG